jgi:hypothetical protein
MTMLYILSAFVPAVGLFAMRAYLKIHSPDLSEIELRGLMRGLGLGVASTIALPLFYIVSAFQQIHFPGSLSFHFPGTLPYVVFAFAGNIINVLGLYRCLRRLTAPGLLAGLILLLIQLLWMWTLLGAFMMSNGF